MHADALTCATRPSRFPRRFPGLRDGRCLCRVVRRYFRLLKVGDVCLLPVAKKGFASRR